MNETREDNVLVSQPSGTVAKGPQHLAGALERIGDQPSRDHWPYRMELILKGRSDPKVAAASANGPEQIGLLVLAGPDHLAFGSHQVDGAKIVEGQAILAHQPTQSSAESEPGNSGAGHDPTRDSQAVQLCLAVELNPGDASLGAHRKSLGVELVPFHGR